MKIIYSLCLLALIMGCKSQNENIYEGENLCKLITTMGENDQKYRSLIKNPFFTVLDSIKKSNNISDEDYVKLPTEEQLNYGFIAKEIVKTHKRKFTKGQRDSIMALQKSLDNKNTELIIDIIKTRGYPSAKNSICNKTPGMILTHTQPEYWEDLNKLIKIEVSNGNMTKVHHDFLVKHFKKKDININGSDVIIID